jgi:hypothetical protein
VIGLDVSIEKVGSVTFVGGGVGGRVGVGVALGVGVGLGVGGRVGVAVGPGVGVGPVMVMLPFVWLGENEAKSVSMNWKSFGKADQVTAVLCPGELLTRTHRVLKRTPAPVSGVTPSLTKAEIRKVLNVPGPVLRTFEPTVQGTVVVKPAGWAELPEGLGIAMAESKRTSA